MTDERGVVQGHFSSVVGSAHTAADTLEPLFGMGDDFQMIIPLINRGNSWRGTHRVLPATRLAPLAGTLLLAVHSVTTHTQRKRKDNQVSQPDTYQMRILVNSTRTARMSVSLRTLFSNTWTISSNVGRCNWSSAVHRLYRSRTLLMQFGLSDGRRFSYATMCISVLPDTFLLRAPLALMSWYGILRVSNSDKTAIRQKEKSSPSVHAHVGKRSTMSTADTHRCRNCTRPLSPCSVRRGSSREGATMACP